MMSSALFFDPLLIHSLCDILKEKKQILDGLNSRNF